MKKTLLLLMAICCVSFSFGQASSYTYVASTGATFETILSPTVLTSATSGVDDGYNTISPASYTFNFNGTDYTQFGASTNGWLKFGSSTATSIPSSLTSVGSINAVMAFARDANLNTGNGGNLTHGAASGGKYVFQFTNNSGGGSGAVSSTAYATFQIVLWGSTSSTPGKIEIVYGSSIGTPSSAGTIGIVDNTNKYLNGVNGSTTSTATAAAYPANGTKYTFNPPPACTGTPVAGTAAATVYSVCTGSAATIAITGTSSGVSGLTFQWEQSADGIGGWANATGGSGATTTIYTTPTYAGTDIYYRLKVTCTPSATAAYTSVIQFTGPAIPTLQASTIVESSATTTSISTAWTNGNGNNRLVYINSTNTFTDPPAAPGTASTTWANAGQQLVYNGTGTSVTVSGLTLGTSYYFRVYEGTKCGTTYYNNVTTGTANPVALSTAGYLKYTVNRNTGITYTPVSGAATTLNTSGNASSGVWDDVNFGAVTFFPFTYAGITVNQFRAVSNGFMTLNSTNTNTAYQNGITNSTGNNMVLAPFYEDLYVTASSEYVKYEITGTAPNRVLTVQWENVEIYNYPGPSLNFQVKLYEADSHIEYVYGVMQGFDGTNPNSATVTNGYVFSYTTGLSATTWSTPAVAGEAIILQQANTTSFTSEGGISTNEGLNKLSVMPDCYSKYTFTPAVSIRPNDVYPGVPAAPINDEPAGAITLTPLPSVPSDLCGSFYTSAFATPTTGVAPEIGGTTADDDVWFKFTANSTNSTITLRGSGGYDAAMQVFSASDLNTVLAAKNANGLTGTSLTETITQTDFTTTINQQYYIRVYHAGGGTQAAATAIVTAGVITGFTVTTPGTGYITATTANSATGATPFVYITDPSGSGAVAKASVTSGAISGIAIQGSQGGSNYTSPTVTIAPSSFGLTGDFSIIVNATPPALANDDIAGAINLVAGNSCVTTAGTTIGATASSQAACGGIADDDVWYKWTVVSPSDMLTVQSGAGFNAHVEVFSSSDNTATGTLTSLGCFNATGVGGAEIISGSGLTIGNTLFIRIYHSASGSGTGTFTVCLTNSPTWAGTNSTDWSDAGNWLPASVPTGSSNVIIPNVTNKPVLTAGAYSVNNINIQASSSVTVNGTGKLRIAGTITNSGTFDVTAGTVEFNGSTAQTLSTTNFTGNVKNLVISNTAGVTLASPLAITGSVGFGASNATLASAGYLTLKSVNGVTAYIADITNGGANSANTITGIVNIEKQFIGGGLASDAPSKRAFRFISHPFSSSISLSQLNGSSAIDVTGSQGAANGFDATVSNAASAFWYNTANGNGSLTDPGWTAFTKTDGVGANAWTKGQGIRILVRGTKGQGLDGSTAYTVGSPTVTMTGTVNTGSQTVALSNSGATWNLVGNPLPAPVNLAAVARTNVSNFFYVWKLNQGLRGAYSIGQNFSTAYNLPANTSFFTQATGAGAQIVFAEANKATTETADVLYRNANTNNVKLKLETASLLWDELVVNFNSKQKDSKDEWDALKLMNGNVSMYTLSSDNMSLSVDSRPAKDGLVIPMGLLSDVARNLTITATDVSLEAGSELYLRDKLENKDTKLDVGSSYTFTTIGATQGEGRFELVMKQLPVLPIIVPSFTVTLSPNPAKDLVKVTFTNAAQANTSIVITNAEGKTVKTVDAGNVQSGQISISLKGIAKGNYFVTLSNGTDRKTEKLIIE